MGSPGSPKKHLWVVISDKNKHAGCWVAVNFTTDEGRASGECLTTRAEHPSLTEPKSWVTFGDACHMTPEKAQYFDKLARIKEVIPGLKAPEALLVKIIAAAKASDAFPVICLDLLE